MRLAFISLYEAYPPTSGAAYVTYSCARLTPCESLLVQLADRDETEHQGHLTIRSLRLDSSSRFKKLACMLPAVKRISEEVAKFNPDHVVLEGASWAVYLAMVASALRRRIPGVRVVYHAHNVEYLLRLQRNGKVVAGLTRWAERYLLTTGSKSFAVSEDDRQRFAEIYGILPDLLPNAVDCEAMCATAPQVARARQRFGITDESLLFMGLYSYPPNTQAVHFLTNEVMPHLVSQRPGVRLVVTGGVVPYSPPWLINPGVVARDELNAILGACRVGVAPIFSGSGTRLKILEYMASGLPVVSTEKGAEGLGAVPGTHMLLAETAEEFCKAILCILENRRLSERLCREASVFVRSRFDWGPVLRQFSAELEGSSTARNARE